MLILAHSWLLLIHLSLRSSRRLLADQRLPVRLAFHARVALGLFRLFPLPTARQQAAHRHPTRDFYSQLHHLVPPLLAFVLKTHWAPPNLFQLLLLIWGQLQLIAEEDCPQVPQVRHVIEYGLV